MSLTVVLMAASFLIVALAIGVLVGAVKSGTRDYERKHGVRTTILSGIAAILAGLAAGGFIAAGTNYSENVRESRQSCLDRGGVVYEKDKFTACFKEHPVELQKL